MPRKTSKPKAKQHEPTPVAPSQASSSPPSTESRLLDRCLEAVGEGIGAIESSIAAASKAVRDSIETESYDDKAASHLAWITKGAAQIAGEIRKAEAHDQAQLRKLTPAIVLEWYRSLSEDERADVRRRQEAIDEGRSILAL